MPIASPPTWVPYPIDLIEDEERLATLDNFDILDTPRESKYDDMVRMLAHSCDTPIAYLSLIDKNRQWFKALYGGDFQDVDLRDSFCTYTIQSDDTMVVEDALIDARFADNPFVTSPEGIRFYAGKPLFSENGQVIGTLCVVDTLPRTLAPKEKFALEVIASLVVHEMQAKVREKQMAAIAREAETNKRIIEQQHGQLKEMLEQIQHMNQDLSVSNAELEAAVKERTAELEMFLYRASHDLARPISSMLGLGMLGTMKAPESELSEVFNQVQDTAKGMRMLLDNLILIHEFQRYTVTPTNLDIRILLQRAQFALQNKLPGAKWDFTCAKGCEYLWNSDERLWNIILACLLENAWVFRKKATALAEITIHYERVQGQGILRFTDQGMGIHPEALPQIFDMFYRGSIDSIGNGLGLYIVRKALDLLCGTISCTSHPYRGTTFTISFPLGASKSSSL